MTDAPRPTFRAIDDNDRAFLREVFFSSWDRALALADWPDEMKKAVLEQQFEAQERGYHSSHPDASYEIVLWDGHAVGRIYVRREEDRIGLMDITLLPEWRNRGIGSGIVRGLLDEAGEAGVPVELYVEKWNPEARRLYLRLGFTDTEDIGTHWKMEWRAGGPSQEKIDS